MKKILIFAIVCLMILPAHVQGQSSPSNDDFTVIDAYYLGRAVAATILGRYRPYTQNQEATQYLNRICQTLVINSNYPSPYNGYTVMILDSSEINAFATPGGHVFITRGLLSQCTSEDMIAAVIAHELAHIMLRHAIFIINETAVERELSDIAGWAGATAARHSPQAARAVNFSNSIGTVVDTLLRSGYSHSQEHEADLEAMLLLGNAGYNPGAIIEVLRVLQLIHANQRGGFSATHPPPILRIAIVEGRRYTDPNTSQHRQTRFRGVRW